MSDPKNFIVRLKTSLAEALGDYIYKVSIEAEGGANDGHTYHSHH